MADTSPTMQDMNNLGLNIDSFDVLLNGDESQDVITRLNLKYPTVAKAIKLMLQNSIFEAKPFSVLPNLVADQTLANGSFAFVYNDSDGNNGLYYKANGQWIKSTLSPISFDYETINILDTSRAEVDKYVDFTSGRICAVAGFCATKSIRIKPNTVYKTSGFYNQQFAFYDASLNYVSGLARTDSNNEFISPANAFYARFTVKPEWLDILVIAEKDKFPASYIPCRPVKIINDLKIRPEQIIDFLTFIKEALSFEIINLIDPANITDGSYVDFSSGGLSFVTGFSVTDFVLIKPNVVYKTSDFYSQQFAFYDSEFKYISGLAQPSQNHEFTTPANAKYARFTVKPEWLDSLVIAEKRLFPDGYIAPNKYIIDDLYLPKESKKTNIIWVSANPADSDPKVKFKGNNAIQNALDSILDASKDNRYKIMVKQGLYKITKADEFLGYRGYPAMILTKDHVDICGQGMDNTFVWAELPYSDADIGKSVDGNMYDRGRYQTVYDYSDDAQLKDISFFAKNLRYTIHIDNPNGANKERKFENVAFVFKGNKGSLTAMGCGTSTGEKTYIVGGVSSSDSNVAFASHNNVAFDTPSFWSFTNHQFITLSQPYAIYMQNDGSLVQDQLELIGNSFGGMGYALGYVDVWLSGNTAYNYDSFNHAEWMVTGHSNEPFLFENNVAGKSLLFKTLETGANNNIRFDPTSSGYFALIKNNQSNSNNSLYVDSREYIDGYIVQDGTIGLPAKAWGCLDLSESVYLYDNGINHTSMAKRLGDRSASPLNLIVIVNGVNQNIVFNKNYSSMSNEQILAEMRAKLIGVSVELVSYGKDYYPNLTDVNEKAYNNGQAYIPKGSIVTKQNGFVKIANEGDAIYGVALDDIPVMFTTSEGVKKGQGRVMKKGYINSNTSAAHFVLSDYQNAPIGTKFKVNNGRLVTDINGKISVNIANGIISINC